MIITVISGIYSIILGIGIIGLWIMLLVSKQVPELETEPIAITFHIIAEGTMGLISVVSGILMLVNLLWAIYPFCVAMGLVIYAVINSAGYYAQKKEWPFVIMFGVILLASTILIVLNIVLI